MCEVYRTICWNIFVIITNIYIILECSLALITQMKIYPQIAINNLVLLKL